MTITNDILKLWHFSTNAFGVLGTELQVHVNL